MKLLLAIVAIASANLCGAQTNHLVNGCWWCEIGDDYGRATLIFKSQVRDWVDGSKTTNYWLRGIGTVRASLWPQGFSGTWNPVASNSAHGTMQWVGGDIATPQGSISATLVSSNDLLITTGGLPFTCVRADLSAPNLRGKWSFKGATQEGKVKGRVLTDPYYNQPDEYPYVWDGSTRDQTFICLFCGPDGELWVVGNYQNSRRFRCDGDFASPRVGLQGFDADHLPLTVAAKFKAAKPH